MEETVSASNPLGTERIGKLMVHFAVPSIIALVLNSLYNMVDAGSLDDIHRIERTSARLYSYARKKICRPFSPQA